MLPWTRAFSVVLDFNHWLGRRVVKLFRKFWNGKTSMYISELIRVRLKSLWTIDSMICVHRYRLSIYEFKFSLRIPCGHPVSIWVNFSVEVQLRDLHDFCGAVRASFAIFTLCFTALCVLPRDLRCPELAVGRGVFILQLQCLYCLSSNGSWTLLVWLVNVSHWRVLLRLLIFVDVIENKSILLHCSESNLFFPI